MNTCKLKKYLFILTFFLCSFRLFGQAYKRTITCGRDTVEVDYIILRTHERIQFKAFECEKVSNLGIRFNVGFSYYNYDAETRSWLGNHGGPLFGTAIAYRNFNLGAAFKPATVNPNQNLDFDGVPLTNEAKLNPIKIDYDLSYSINIKNNVSIEPYVAFTKNYFRVINEAELGKSYHIDKIFGWSVGAAINKYFQLKDYQFLAVFARYGYGLTDFRKVHPNLGVGYSEFTVGIAYKAFAKRRSFRPISF